MDASICRPRVRAAALALALFVGFAAPRASAQLRIVTYNTNTFGTQGDVPGLPSNFRTVRPEADIVFRALGEESVNGIQRAPDIILLQEQQQVGSTTENLLQRLNNVYADQGITFARGQLNPGITGDPGSGLGTGPGGFDGSEIRQSFIYRTDSVELITEDFFGNISGTNQPRATQFIQFRPVGYGPEADLFLFNSHFEADDDRGFGGDLFARENEATDIRNFITANNLGSSNVIVAGDLNVDSNFETSGVSLFGGRSALQILSDGTDAGGRVLDPLFPPDPVTGVVPNVDFQIFSSGVPNTQAGVNLEPFLTQSPCASGCSLTGGGIDDRFDFILQSDELLDGEGLASIPGTLRSFGNNGSTGNGSINSGNTIQINGLTSFTTAQVLDALFAASDHLPVVEDFQLPAVLDAFVGAVPEVVTQGDDVDVALTIFNAADVDVPIGADELEFSFFASGALSGFGSGVDAALGTTPSTLIGLDTSTVGLQTGVITITTSSPGVPDAELTIPIEFDVVAAALDGDFNDDGVIDAADFVIARDNAGPNGPLADFQEFVENFSDSSAASADAATVPEPTAALLLLLSAGVGLALLRR